MIIKIEAIVREEKLEDVKEALSNIEVNGITVSQVMGAGMQKGMTEIVLGQEIDIPLYPKLNLKLWFLQKSGSKKRFRLSKRLHSQEKLETEKFSATICVAFSVFAHKKLDLMR